MRNIPAMTIVSSCLAGRFSVVLEQVLGGTYRCAHGDASGFFVSSHLLPTSFFKKKMRNLSGMTKNVVPSLLYSNMFFPIIIP